MTVGLRVGDSYYEIGSPGLLHCFLSTINYNLEPRGWGSRYPFLMNGLYSGSLQWQICDLALLELADIRQNLEGYLPSKLVWDIDNLALVPPWDEIFSFTSSDLIAYFITITGEDLCTVLSIALTEAIAQQVDIYLEQQ